MRELQKEQISLYPIVDYMVDEMGKYIEGIFPLLKIMEEQEESKNAEYELFKKIWDDWSSYLGG